MSFGGFAGREDKTIMAYTESRYAFSTAYIWDPLYIEWGPLALTEKDFLKMNL